MNGQQIAQENVAKVQRWISERDAVGDYVDYERQGKINRSSICAELDFARSVINQNPTVKALLQEAEERWYGTGKKDRKAASIRSERKAELSIAENSRLKDEIAKLKAENSLLKRQLSRFSAMADVLAETGIAPR